jgi:hypothetical protein
MSSHQRILFLCDESDVDVVERSFADSEAITPIVETTEKILRFGVREYLRQTIETIYLNPELYDGIVGTHDSSAVFAAVLAQETGKTFASVRSIINCQNKYLSRRIQSRLVPEHTPTFCLALDYLRDPDQLMTPFFIKPVRANISFGSHRIESPEELEYYIGMESQDIAFYNTYYLEALSFSSKYHHALNLATCNSFLCEDLITGEQVTVDGFAFQGDIHLFGFTKAIYYPKTNCFSHHVFPFPLSAELDTKIRRALDILIPALELDNSFFNVELRVDESAKSFSIIEVNSRIAFQFAKTIQTVTGLDPLKMLCEVAVGRKPDLNAHGQEGPRYCYNFELHAFSDARVLHTPTQSAYEELKLKFPQVTVRNLIQENALLSEFKHNPESFRYCILDIPGDSEEEIMSAYHEVTAILNYAFETVDESLLPKP